MRSIGLGLVAIFVVTSWGCGRSPTGNVDPEPAPLAAGDHELEIEHDGRTRWSIVHIPPQAAGGERLPLVLALHGGGGNPEQFKPESGFDALSDAEGFLVAYPAGTGVFPRLLLTWNAGTDCCGFALEQGVDDVGFLLALVDDLADRTPVDLDRIYVSGHSNGGIMSYRMAAEASDRIAAIAPVAGAMMLESFAPARPVPLLHIHSVDDPRALYEGGLGPPFPLGGNQVLHQPVLHGIEAWVARNDCSPAPTESESIAGEPGSYDDGNSAVALTWEPCSSGAAVRHWRLNGVGHGWPGSIPPPGREDLIGGSTLLISAAAEAWGFFENESL